MTREEAINHIKDIICENNTVKHSDMVVFEEEKEALRMAIKALSQESCEDAEQIDYHDDFETASRKIHDYEERQKQNDKKCGSYNNTNTFKSCCDCKLIGTESCYMGCGGSKSLYKPKQKSEPCTDTVSIRKDALKTRVGNIVAYNVEWLKKHWQMEMDIVCGVKPCTDAVSREAVLNIASLHTLTVNESVEAIKRLPSVQPSLKEQEPMRDFTEEEAEAYSKALDRIYKPTGLNVFNEPCEDAISRDAVIDAIERVRNNHAYDELEEIQKLPSVTPSRHKGHWIKYGNLWKCSECEDLSCCHENYCNNCGARMVEPQESEEKE